MLDHIDKIMETVAEVKQVVLESEPYIKECDYFDGRVFLILELISVLCCGVC